jgi:cyclopropane fatty-acyl-phospholipid synthase-like methyltransferase
VPVLQHVTPGSTALDIGCNKGNDAIFLAGHGYQVLGIDINGAVIQMARTRAQEITTPGSARLGVADIFEEPIADHFNVVLLIRLLTCFAERQEWDAVLRRSTQLLQPRGYIYIHDFLMSPDIEVYRIRQAARIRP